MESDFGTLEFESKCHEKKTKREYCWRNFHLVVSVLGGVFTLALCFTIYQCWHMNQELHSLKHLLNETKRELDSKLHFIDDNLPRIRSLTEKVDALHNTTDRLSNELNLSRDQVAALSNEAKEQNSSTAKLFEELSNTISHLLFNLQSTDGKTVLLQKLLDDQSKELKLSNNQTVALDHQVKEQKSFTEKQIFEMSENVSKLNSTSAGLDRKIEGLDQSIVRMQAALSFLNLRIEENVSKVMPLITLANNITDLKTKMYSIQSYTYWVCTNHHSHGDCSKLNN